MKLDKKLLAPTEGGGFENVRPKSGAPLKTYKGRHPRRNWKAAKKAAQWER